MANVPEARDDGFNPVQRRKRGTPADTGSITKRDAAFLGEQSEWRDCSLRAIASEIMKIRKECNGKSLRLAKASRRSGIEWMPTGNGSIISRSRSSRSMIRILMEEQEEITTIANDMKPPTRAAEIGARRSRSAEMVTTKIPVRVWRYGTLVQQ